MSVNYEVGRGKRAECSLQALGSLSVKVSLHRRRPSGIKVQPGAQPKLSMEPSLSLPRYESQCTSNVLHSKTLACSFSDILSLIYWKQKSQITLSPPSAAFSLRNGDCAFRKTMLFVFLYRNMHNHIIMYIPNTRTFNSHHS